VYRVPQEILAKATGLNDLKKAFGRILEAA